MKEKSLCGGRRPQRLRHTGRGERRLPPRDRPDAGDRGKALQGKETIPRGCSSSVLNPSQIYNEMTVPDWGPSIEGLDMDHIATYVRPNTRMQQRLEGRAPRTSRTPSSAWASLRRSASLSPASARSTTPSLFTTMSRTAVAAEGVVYTDMESAMKGEYADMVRKYFMKLVTPRDHKFAALHGAVWSGGSFVYVPKGVQLSIPLQSYFRLNAKGAGQFEHTLIIVDEGASLHFIEGCSAPKYNVANLHAGCVELYRQEGREAPLFHHRELVEEYVQPQHQARARGRGRHDRVGIRLLRLPRRLPVPHEHPQGRQLPHGVHRRDLRRRAARISTPARRSSTSARTPAPI